MVKPLIIAVAALLAFAPVTVAVAQGGPPQKKFQGGGKGGGQGGFAQKRSPNFGRPNQVGQRNFSGQNRSFRSNRGRNIAAGAAAVGALGLIGGAIAADQAARAERYEPAPRRYYAPAYRRRVYEEPVEYYEDDDF